MELGLSREELVELYNLTERSFDPAVQTEIKVRAKEFGDQLATLPEDTPRDFAVLLTFVINAIRTNNERLLEQLRPDESE